MNNTSEDKKERERIYQKEYRLKNKDILLQKQREYHKKYYSINKIKVLEKQKKYNDKNKEKRKSYGREYARLNREKINKRVKNKFKNNSTLRILNALRCRIKCALKNKIHIKSQKTLKLLGCSLDTVRQHIESQFKEGMSWDNYGHKGWHLDHIKPCASFDLTDPKQQKQCFHYTNLQPLWWWENLEKSDKILPIDFYKNNLALLR
jgi:hypothetical protein